MIEGANILIVDDNDSIRGLFSRVLRPAGSRVMEAGSIEECKDCLAGHSIDLLFLDLFLPDGNGLELLHALKRNSPDIPVIIITGKGTVERAVEAMKAGAFDFLRKPLEHVDLIRVTANRALEQRIDSRFCLDRLIGRSRAMTKIFQSARQIAETDATVIIQGESGSGKELLAQAIHYNSPRRIHKFIPIDCGSLPPSLIESELFGHLKGSFTGAYRDVKGLFREAHHGSIFLDEIGELPLQVQTKLLRVLQEREVRPVGSSESIPVDVRVIAASNRDLAREVREGRFREDLYYRLNVVLLKLPPLRERSEDIPLLVERFLAEHEKRTGKKFRLSADAVQKLYLHDWPGNVRELQNCVEQAIALSDRELIRAEDLPDLKSEAELETKNNPMETAPEDAPISLEYYEKLAIERALAATGWDVDRAARLLEVGLSTMYRKMKRHGVPSKRAAAPEKIKF